MVSPTQFPTLIPTCQPTALPTTVPSAQPTTAPTERPTQHSAMPYEVIIGVEQVEFILLFCIYSDCSNSLLFIGRDRHQQDQL